MWTDDVAPTAVVKVTLYSRPGWDRTMAEVLSVRRLGPSLVAEVKSWETAEVLAVPVNEHSIELVDGPVPWGEVPRGA